MVDIHNWSHKPPGLSQHGFWVLLTCHHTRTLTADLCSDMGRLKDLRCQYLFVPTGFFCKLSPESVHFGFLGTDIRGTETSWVTLRISTVVNVDGDRLWLIKEVKVGLLGILIREGNKQLYIPEFHFNIILIVRNYSWLIGKDPDAGRDWGQEKKGVTEDEMAGWHHRLDGHKFE